MRTFALHFLLAFIAAYLILKSSFWPFAYNAVNAVAVFLAIFTFFWLLSFFIRRQYFRKLPKGLSFALFFLKELLIANLKIAYDIITPHYILQPAVIAFPLSLKTEEEITFLAVVISLTPGTLSLDVSDDKKTLYVHALYTNNYDLDRIRNQLKNGFERRIMELVA